MCKIIVPGFCCDAPEITSRRYQTHKVKTTAPINEDNPGNAQNEDPLDEAQGIRAMGIKNHKVKIMTMSTQTPMRTTPEMHKTKIHIMTL